MYLQSYATCVFIKPCEIYFCDIFDIKKNDKNDRINWMFFHVT